MSDEFTAIPEAMMGFSGLIDGAGAVISAVGSADSMAMLSEAGTAIGPIGAVYLGPYAGAQASNLAGTLMVGAVHAAIGAATAGSQAAIVAADSISL
jgi:hypothetical protein